MDVFKRIHAELDAVKRLRTYEVVMKDGQTFTTKARDRKAAISQVLAGKGKWVGKYFKTFKTIQASVQK